MTTTTEREPQYARDATGRVLRLFTGSGGRTMARPVRTPGAPLAAASIVWLDRTAVDALTPVTTRWGVLYTCSSENADGPDLVTLVGDTWADTDDHVSTTNRIGGTSGVRAVLARSFDGAEFHIHGHPASTAREYLARFILTGKGF